MKRGKKKRLGQRVKGKGENVRIWKREIEGRKNKWGKRVKSKGKDARMNGKRGRVREKM